MNLIGLLEAFVCWWDQLGGQGMGMEMGAAAEADSGGRTTIPKRLREEFRIKPGDEFRFEEREGVIILRREIRATHKDRTNRKWGREAFLDAGEATFGEEQNPP